MSQTSKQLLGPNSFLSENVPDPTDFPPQANAPGLRRLDAAFRCTICGETYDAPVTLPCGHCFCSGCLRPTMAIKQECPGCRKVANEGHIRPNHVMEEAINAWNECRSYILGLVRRERESRESIQPSRKRKRTGDSSPSVTLGTPGPSRVTPVDATSPWSVKRSLVLSEFEDRKNLQQETDSITIPSSDVEEDEIQSNSTLNPKPDALVKCPLCSKRVQFKKVNSHIDLGCKEPSNEDASVTWSRILKTKSRSQKGKHRMSTSESDDDSPLPKASYATLKEKQIRGMLQEHGLAIHGGRPQLEQRHQRWVMIYNANLDRSISNRKDRTVLRQELKRWEESVSKKKKPIVHDMKDHAKLHKMEFHRLIQVARQNKDWTSSRMVGDTTPNPPSSEQGAQQPHPNSQVQHQYSLPPGIGGASVVDSEEEGADA